MDNLNTGMNTNTFGQQLMDDFLASAEMEAFRMAELATKNTVDAMDIIELTVNTWVKKHRHKPFDQWLFQFYKTLYSHIVDFERREIPLHRCLDVRNASLCLQETDPVEKNSGFAVAIEQAGFNEEFNNALIAVLGHLPLPQQQAFLLCEWQCFSIEQVAQMLVEEPVIIANRHASAMTGLQDALAPFIKAGDAGLIVRVIAALQESVADISYAQAYQLRYIRLQALKQVDAQPIFTWVLFSCVMSLCLFVFWWLQIPEQIQTQSVFYSDESLTAGYPQVWQENAELLENLEFFSWLSLQGILPVDKVSNEMALVPRTSTAFEGQFKQQKLQARQRFAQWLALEPEQKASLRADFAFFKQFTGSFQQTLRFHQAVYAQLPVDRQQALRLQWQALTADERQQLQIAMNKARSEL